MATQIGQTLSAQDFSKQYPTQVGTTLSAQDFTKRYPTPPDKPVATKGILTKIGEAFSLPQVGQDIAQATYLMTGGQSKIDKITQQYITNGSTMAALAKKQTDPALKMKYAQMAVENYTQAQQVGKNIIGNTRSPEQIVGDFVGLGADVLSGGTLSSGTAIAKPAATTILQGALRGAGQGAIQGGSFGLATGLAKGLQGNGNVGQVAKSTVVGGLGGAAGGAVIGGVIGGASGAYNGYKQRQLLLGTQENLGIKPALPETVKANPTLKPVVEEAQNQGMSDKDINFLATASPEDKPTMAKMLNLAEQAQTDNRVIQRPLDIVGDNGTKLLKVVKNANTSAGNQLNTIAKGLEGQTVDATSMHDQAMQLLSDVGVQEGVDKSGNPILDWSESQFSKTPRLQKQLENALSDLPNGETDALAMHNFKQSLYNLSDYGTQGEGLSGKADNIIKKVAHLADGTLDTNFPQYNAVNTDFATTKNLLDDAKTVIGKRVDFNTTAGKQAFGQALRSAFSNNKSRGIVLQFISDLQDTANQYGANSKQNLLDQALFTQILEENFGSPAVTGLSGEVEKAINTTKTVGNAIKHPLGATVDLVGNVAKKLQGQTPANKIAILKALLK